MAEENEQDNNFNPVSAAVFANSGRSLNPWVQSTGFRTHGLRHRSLNQSNDPRIAEDFLLNTRFLRHDRETEISIQGYFFDPSILMTTLSGREDKTGRLVVNLSTGIKLRRELGDVLEHRRSRRAYTGDPMTLDYFATLLRSAGAITGQATVNLMSGKQTVQHFRTAPSGGGLYPIDIYIAVLRVTGLERGIYRYDPLDDALLQSGNQQDVEKLLSAFAAPEELITLTLANVVFLLVGHPWRSMRKYGNRGLRYLFLEAGEIAQNINLVTEALGFGAVDCAGIYDDEAHEAMHLDGLYQTLVHTVIVGYPG